MIEEESDATYAALLDAIETDGGFYLECSNEHGSLPPRRVCPECGSTPLSREPLPKSGTIETYTEIHVTPPRFQDEGPIVVAIAEFGPVRLTGYVQDSDGDTIELGQPIELDVNEHRDMSERFIVFHLK
ncbi:Zn-ribbon domain-containing OB-fold protein [Haladaptatus sp. DFWS20]|uniref:Zn-ribbon domain-containing OB-fold protein n=1 Tax=Haladaptatus sp. DFWS20 TaxID=3403467 RepID=UPI003EB7F22A